MLNKNCFAVLPTSGCRDVRGGSYWGLTSKQTLEIAAWISCLAARRYSSVVLVGQSAGATALRMYQQ